MQRLVLRFFVILGGVGLTAFMYQNCGPGFAVKESVANNFDLASSALQGATCPFNGQFIVGGGSVTAYRFPSVPSGQTCVSETRTCSGGDLSGSYTNASCLVTAPGNCALGAQEVPNGVVASGYSAQQVAPGQACALTSATCRLGVFSSPIYPTCNVATVSSCPFNGQFVPEGVAITAYLASSVPFGALCSPELRTCKDGALTGSFNAATCTAAPAATCKFGSNTVADGTPIQVFSTSKVPFGQTCGSVQKPITCKNGIFVFADGTLASSNVNYFASCVPSPTSTCQYGNKTLQSGDTVSGYLQPTVPSDKTCDISTATCDGGVMKGLPIIIVNGQPSTQNALLSSTCKVGGCVYAGNVVADHEVVTAYSTSLVGHSQSCESVKKPLTCNNQKITDASGAVASNYVTSCQSAATTSCTFTNWIDGLKSVPVGTGQTVTGYSSTTVLQGTTCASVQEDVSCNDGIISLNGVAQASALNGIFYLYNSCNVGACKISGQTVLDGATIPAYSSSFVAYGQSCSTVQTTLTCKNTSLLNANGAAGNYSTTCAPMPTADCSVNDWSNGLTLIKIPNNQTLTGFTRGSVAAGDTCDKYRTNLACSLGLISTNGGPASPSSPNFYSTCK